MKRSFISPNLCEKSTVCAYGLARLGYVGTWLCGGDQDQVLSAYVMSSLLGYKGAYVNILVDKPVLTISLILNMNDHKLTP